MTKKILVVDNHPLILRMLSSFLEKQGYEVKTASDGLAALTLLESYTPDVALLDLVMPGISGDRLCRMIRNIPRLKSIRIVILSAIAAEEAVDYRAIGADACVAKGSMQSIQHHVMELLQRLDDHVVPPPAMVMNVEGLRFRSITRELLASKKHFESIVDHMADGFFELSPEGRILFANPAAIHLCGINEEKLLAAEFVALFAESSRQAVTDLLAAPPSDAQVSSGTMQAELRNGTHIDLRIIDLRQEKESPTLVMILRDITRRRQAELAHENSETRFRELFNNMPSGVAIYEAKDPEASDFVFVDFNQTAERIEKIGREKVIGRSLLETFPGARELGVLDTLQRVWKTGTPEHLPIGRYQDNRLSGWRENFIYRLPSGEVVAVYTDATQRKEAEHRLEVEAALNEALARISRTIIASDSIEEVSASLLEEALDLTGSGYGIVDIVEPPTGRLRSTAFSPEISKICPMTRENDLTYHQPVGLVRWVLDNRTPILSNAPEDDAKVLAGTVEPPPIGRLLAAPALLEGELVGLIAVANSSRGYTKRDLAALEQFASLLALAVQKKRALAQIARLAHHDQLTGLINRHIFPDRLAQAMILARRHRKKVALLYIDLDRFKGINDQYGHQVGDAVLREVAVRLRNGLRDADSIARMGGDEFVAILQDITEAGDALVVAAKLVEQLEAPIDHKGLDLAVAASIGISIYPDHGRDIDLLLHRADEAMYMAKRSFSLRYALHGAPPPAGTP
ncbi:MAG: diguanylate cyclase domain-containing protein [Thermodesulfobacteriota bacterium]